MLASIMEIFSSAIYIITILLLKAFRNLKTYHNFLKYFYNIFFAKKKKNLHNIHFPCNLIFKNIFTILFVIRFGYIIKNIYFFKLIYKFFIKPFITLT